MTSFVQSVKSPVGFESWPDFSDRRLWYHSISRIISKNFQKIFSDQKFEIFYILILLKLFYYKKGAKWNSIWIQAAVKSLPSSWRHFAAGLTLFRLWMRNRASRTVHHGLSCPGSSSGLSVKPSQGKEKRFQINWKRFRWWGQSCQNYKGIFTGSYERSGHPCHMAIFKSTLVLFSANNRDS